VTSNTISHCWNKTDILPDFISTEQTDNSYEEDLELLIEQLPFDNPMTTQEYIEIDKTMPIFSIPTNEEILAALQEEEEEEEDSLKPSIVVSNNEALVSLNNILSFLDNSSDNFQVCKEDFKVINQLQK